MLTHLLLLLLVAPILGGAEILPRPLAGWRYSFESARLQPVATSQAPELLPWTRHLSAQERATWMAQPEPVVDVWGTLLAQTLPLALKETNEFLPFSLQSDFNLWLFERVPFAAKTQRSGLILSAMDLYRANQSERVCLLSHELHHLALLRAGFGSRAEDPLDEVLTALLAEGAATWICVSRGWQAEPAGERVASAFSELRSVLQRPHQGLEGSRGLFGRDKSGYLAGLWMVRAVERHLGRTAWVSLFELDSEDAGRAFVDLYLDTKPPPLLSFEIKERKTDAHQ